MSEGLLTYNLKRLYRIAGNFRGVQFSRMASLQSFRGLIFVDVRHHAHYTLYNHTYFAGLIFVDSCLSAKIAKIGPLKNFPLYSNADEHWAKGGEYSSSWLSVFA